MLRHVAVCIALLVIATLPTIAEEYGAETRQLGSVEAWKRDVSVRLTQARRYPAALTPGQEGTAKVAFRIDRAGHLMASWLIEASGIPAIDAEALAIVERAQPYAALPAEVPDDSAVLTVPFHFGAMGPSFVEGDFPESWKRQVYARLTGAVEDAKRRLARMSDTKRQSIRIPDDAYTVKVGISLDRSGKLVTSWLVENGRVPALDAEALAIVRRAEPYPPPPVDTKGQDFQLVLPITFNAVMPWDDPGLKAKLNSVCRGC